MNLLLVKFQCLKSSMDEKYVLFGCHDVEYEMSCKNDGLISRLAFLDQTRVG